jgi:hypothetical protein
MEIKTENLEKNGTDGNSKNLPEKDDQVIDKKRSLEIDNFKNEVRKKEIDEFKKDVRKKRTYFTPKAKLPNKGEMIKIYKELCKQQGLECKYSDRDFQKRIKKPELKDMIDDLYQGGYGEVNEQTKEIIEIKEKPRTTKSTRSNASRFYFKIEWLLMQFLEKYLAQTEYNINNYSDVMIQNKKEFIKEIEEILETYPQYEMYVDPLLRHAVTHGVNITYQLKNNSKSDPSNRLQRVVKRDIPLAKNISKRKATSKIPKKTSDIPLKQTSGKKVLSKIPGYKL